MSPSGPRDPCERCAKCGAPMYATDAICMSCGAERALPGRTPHAPPEASASAPLAPTIPATSETTLFETEESDRTGPQARPSPRLGELSSYIVERFGSAWGFLGWLLFALWYLIPILSAGIPHAPMIWWGITLLILLWWTIDLNDQQVAGWQIAVGLVMLTIGFLPRGGFLILACWVLYWTRVRE